MKNRILRIIEAIVVLVFFLQALRAVFSVMFGIIYDQIFEGALSAWLPVSNLLVLAALAAPALFGLLAGKAQPARAARSGLLSTLAIITALSRIALTINDPVARYWGSLVTLAAGGLYLAALLVLARPMAFPALVGALTLDQVLRAAGHTYDISLRSGWLPAQIAWAAATIALAIWLQRSADSTEPVVAGLGPLSGAALGAWLFLETSLLTLPNGIARWTQIDYAIAAPVLVVLTALPLLPVVYRLIWGGRVHAAIRFAAAAACAAGLMVGYFASGPLAGIAVLLAQLCAAAALMYILDDGPSSHRPAGLWLALGGVLFLVLNFVNAFAFTYPYVLPAMRGMGWAVYLAATLIIAWRMLINPPPADELTAPPARTRLPALAGLAALAAVAISAWPLPVSTLGDSGTVRVATYNIHYGYDDAWHLTLEDIARTIEDSGADIVAMQEVDTGRMTSYLIDNAYYLARRLRMNVLYVPTVEHLTGIALLYRGPAISTGQALITSLQEQTGIAYAQVETGSQPLHAYGIWMGLSDEDTQTQIAEALAFIGDASPAVFGGDFNAEDGSPVVTAVEQAGFVDPFTALGSVPAPFTSPAPDPRSRIDYVWVRGLQPTQAEVLPSLASDHRMVIIEVELPAQP
jgi:endonuclease/exonuclease/phosphatase family metal-dependent hydrolase